MDTTFEKPTVVVGIDGSADSRLALDRGIRSAARRGARVRAVAVDELPEARGPWSIGPADVVPPDRDRLGRTAADVVRALVDEVVAAVGPDLLEVPEVTVEVVGGRPADVLPVLAAGADELVVGHRGRGALASAVLGSVGWACVLHATCPVTVVPAPWEGAATTPVVVVGFDGSDDGIVALGYALQQAAWRAAGLRVVVAYDPPELWAEGYGVLLPGTEETCAELRNDAAAAVEKVRAAGDDDLRAVPWTVESALGNPSAVLVAASRGAELLVVGHRGRGSARSVLLGSHGLDCVVHAHCPVTVVPTPATLHEAPGEPDRAGAAPRPDVPLRSHPVVVGVDGSPGADRALTWALERARRTDRDVRIVRAYDPPAIWPASMIDGLRIDDEAVRREIAASTRVQVDRVRASMGEPPRVDVEAVAGHPVDVLLAAADGADCLVVGHRDRGVLRATVLGSTALSLLVHARCTVVVVPAAPPVGPRPGGGPTVVVGVGAVEPARLAVLHALGEAAQRGGRVLAVTGFLPVLTGPASTAMTAPTVQDIRSAIEVGVRVLVDEVRAGFADRNGGVAPRVDLRVSPESAVWALVDAARDVEAELIVLGHRGRGALTTRLLGSVGHGVLLHAASPVMVVPEPEDVSPGPAPAAPSHARSAVGSPLPVGPIA